MEKIKSGQILVTPLARIPTSGGDVMHAIKKSDKGYTGFGEAYFSQVEQGAVKAWKKHLRMTMNLVVPTGIVRFIFVDLSNETRFREEIIGTSRYARITVPPGIWFGFQGISETNSLVLNIADIQHDREECLRKEITEIPFDWSKQIS